VEFVEDDGADPGEFRVRNHAAGEDAFSEEAQARLRTDDLFETYLVTDGVADRFRKFGGNTARRQAGGDAPRLEHQHRAPELQQSGWDARGFAGAGGGFDDEIRVRAEAVEDGRKKWIDRQHFVSA